MRRRLGVASVVVALVAAALGAGIGSGTAGGATGSATLAPPCRLLPTDGLVSRTTTVDGVPRTYELHVPRAVLDGPVAMVIAFHGLGGAGAVHTDRAGWVEHADARGFIVVAPDGLARSWRFDEGSPDVVFVDQLVAELVDSGCVDARRVHAVGHSMGGHFAHRIACDLSDVVASVGVYAGGPPGALRVGADCRPARPVSVTMYHGDADTVRRIELGRTARDEWVARNGCEDEPAVTELDDGVAMRWGCPRGTTVAWREFRGQPHAWPEEPRRSEMAGEILDFFDRNVLPLHLAPGRGAPNEMQLVRSYSASFHGFGGVAGPRSGTEGGAAVHAWLAAQFDRLGLDVRTQAFGFERFVVHRAGLEVAAPGGGFAPSVFPLYYRGATGPAGITAPLADLGSGSTAEFEGRDVSGKIVVVSSARAFNARVVALEQAYEAAVAGGAAGLVVGVDGPGNEIFTPNTPVQRELGPLPTLLVGDHDGRRLRTLAGSAATLVLDAEITAPATRLVKPTQRQPVEGIAYNTVAVVPGLDDEMVIIGTPMNGWFEVASERASGIAVLLEVARRFATSPTPPQHTLVFVGLGGHEVEAGGLHRFLACVDTTKVAAYVHMGATVAGRHFEEIGDQIVDVGVQEAGRTMYMSENPLLYQQVAAAFAPHPGVQVLKPGPGGVANPGEQADAYAYGVPIAAISGANLLFHTRADVPDTLSQSLLAPMSDAYAALVTSLAVTPASDLRTAGPVQPALAEEPAGTTCPSDVDR